MSEVAKINLQGPVYDPRQNRSREAPMSERIRQGRQDALQNALGMYKVKAAQYQNEQMGALQRSEEFLAKNASDLFSAKANALDTDSWKFTKPGAREEFFQKWKKEVGGNYQGFMKTYDAAKSAEQEGMLKSLMMDRKKFRTEIEYKRAFSDMFNELSDGDRNQLLSQSSPEVYSKINELYITPDDDDWFEWEDIKDPFVRMGLDREGGAENWAKGTVGAGVGLAALGTFALTRGRKGSKELMEAAKKYKIGGLEIKEGRKKLQSLYNTPGVAGKGRGALNRARRAGIGQGIDALDNIPANKVPELLKQMDEAVKTGSITSNDRTMLKRILTNLTKEGGDVSKKKLAASMISEGAQGQGLLNKLKNLKGKAQIGALVGAVGAGYAGSTAGSTFDEDGSTKGERIGGHLAMGALSAPAAAQGLKGLFDKFKSKFGDKAGSKMVDLVAKKGAQKLGAKAVMALLPGANLMALGFTVWEMAQITRILFEEEEKGNI